MDYGFYNPYNGYSAPPAWQNRPAANGWQSSSQPQQTGPGWIMAPSVRQVEQVSVQPGQKAWVMVQNEPVFALRTADQMGLVTTEYYRFERINPEDSTPCGAEYVTRKEFEEFVSSLRKEGIE